MINERIGEYTLVRSIGRGGFGSVWEARAEDDRVVAMKILNPQVLENEKVVRKFFHEAMILAKLDHSNICKLHDFFPEGDNYIIVMEYVQGVELKQLLAQCEGPLPFAQAYTIARQALDAFQYAYTNGILHRDIKPANIMVTSDDTAKIMDFGIASMSTVASQNTAASMLSISYVPPERFDKDRVIDVRSDIYSLALVFYEMFAGRRPFTATETSQVMFSHLNEIPEPPATYAAGLPAQISAAISRALEKDPADRFEDFAAFARAMKIDAQAFEDATVVVDDAATVVASSLPAAAATAAPAPSASPPAASKKSLRWAAVFILLALVLGGGGYLLLPAKAPIATTSTSVARRAAPAPAAPAISETRNPVDGSIMMGIPAGAFVMGSDRYSAEKPVQTIFLDAYRIDKFPVTNEKFAAFVAATGYVTDAEKDGAGMVRIGRRWKRVDGAFWRKPDGLTDIAGREDHPVAQVSYNDAAGYCRWAQKDLPTEAQWEKAARGPDGNEYPWGSAEPNDTMANFDNIVGTTTPVGSYVKGQSPYGLQDMAGNVYQWCRDWYATGERAAKNPAGPATGEERVIKGGSFVEGIESLRSANRDRYAPNYSSFLFGFRCAQAE